MMKRQQQGAMHPVQVLYLSLGSHLGRSGVVHHHSRAARTLREGQFDAHEITKFSGPDYLRYLQA
jgi:hypothetical protein